MMKPRLIMENVTQTFQDGESSVTILDGLSLEVGEGELVAVTGPSGSGKSTFLSIAGALLSPTAGEVSVDGQPLGGMDAGQLADLRLNKLGFVFQSANLIPYLRVEEQLLLVAKLSGTPAAAASERARELLERLGLGHRRRYYPEKLSGGERQRAAVARAWMNDPSVIYADEPTASLDAERGRDVVRMLRDGVKEQRKAGVMVTHDERVLEFCDRVLKLENGRLQPA
ncbi:MULTISPECIES: ABC transporter ATP-binding protein [unclassified Paenibacillus]|uniref:ABC transporter ATP-binding protein n=1 Tax=unclassified Paenibacillus TaxID=185978 RepID=UPI000954CB26|nr:MULTISPECIES: ABC transporter ATP-binding protein [unclassified Paenibacillus]ASS64827.1 ABC transporter ATP-binding protein [Paenibacillus sp. RUD330]SIR04751.1 putative ABC transport system ATP-binding protein [Paenibacillus sp. RU4X]SIR30545.1 putative ABC transport system ATP-binding protein [Paenibacillus sp. RU4T]